jgi:hypothetical protein
MSIVKLLHLKSFCLFLENLVIKIQTILQSSPALFCWFGLHKWYYKWPRKGSYPRECLRCGLRID